MAKVSRLDDDPSTLLSVATDTSLRGTTASTGCAPGIDRHEKRVRRAAIGDERNAAIEHAGFVVVADAGRAATGPPGCRLGRRHDQAGTAQHVGERSRRARRVRHPRHRPGGCSGLDQRHQQQLPAGLLQREREIKGAETLTAVVFRNDGRQPFRVERRAPGFAVHVLVGRPQRAQALGAAVIDAQPRSGLGEQALLLGQQQVQGNSPVVRIPELF